MRPPKIITDYAKRYVEMPVRIDQWDDIDVSQARDRALKAIKHYKDLKKTAQRIEREKQEIAEWLKQFES